MACLLKWPLFYQTLTFYLTTSHLLLHAKCIVLCIWYTIVTLLPNMIMNSLETGFFTISLKQYSVLIMVASQLSSEFQHKSTLCA